MNYKIEVNEQSDKLCREGTLLDLNFYSGIPISFFINCRAIYQRNKDSCNKDLMSTKRRLPHVNKLSNGGLIITQKCQ